MKKRAVLAFTIALGLIGVLVYAVGWQEVLKAASRTSPLVYAVAFASTLGALTCRMLVWHHILAIVDKPRPYWLITGVFMTAMVTKYVIPYGQITSGVGIAAVVSRYYDAEYEEALAGVISADFLNYLPYYSWGSIGAMVVLITYSPEFMFSAYAAPVVLLIAAVVLFVGVLWYRRDTVLTGVLAITDSLNQLSSRFIGQESRVLHRENVMERFRGFFTTLDLVPRDKQAVLTALLFAHIGWLGLAGALYFTALALGTPVSLGLAVFAVAISKLGFVVPTPGGLGGVEFTLATVLYLIAPVTFAAATATALLWRLATYWFTILLGGLTAMAVTIKDPLPPNAD